MMEHTWLRLRNSLGHLKQTEPSRICPFVESNIYKVLHWELLFVVYLQNMSQLHRLDCSDGGLLRMEGVRALQPGLQMNRSLRELNLRDCAIRDEGIRLVADALAGNARIEILNINCNGITSNGLDDITRILKTTHLKTIDLGINCVVVNHRSDTAQRFALCLSRHEFLKELYLRSCQLGDGGIHIITNALDGNTILEVLDIGWNHISSYGHPAVMRLIESTRIRSINLHGNDGVFSNESASQQFSATLVCQNTSLQELLGIPAATGQLCDTANFVCARNKYLNHVNLLLASPPPSQQPLQQQQWNDTSRSIAMMLKVWHKAITKFAMVVPNKAGTSAIFKLFQARPQLLEKRIKRPADASTASSAAVVMVASRDSAPHEDNNRNQDSAAYSMQVTTIDGQKRQRL